jgi:hypothetical protein
LHSTSRDRALLVGFGTGVIAATLHRAGYRHLDVVEPCPDVARLAPKYFADANEHVAEQPNVDVRGGDGRSYLFKTTKRYDLFVVDVIDIWPARATALYDREFYALAREKLVRGGVFATRLELDRLAPPDVVSLVATVRTEFRRVWVYVHGVRGVIIACSEDCAPGPASVAAIKAARELEPIVAARRGVKQWLADRWLSPDAVDRLLADVAARGVAADELTSTEDNLLLEHAAQRVNLRDADSLQKSNTALLKSFLPPSRLEGTHFSEEDWPGTTPYTETKPPESPGLTRDVGHGKTEP